MHLHPGAFRRALCRIAGAAVAVVLMLSLFYMLAVISIDLGEWWRSLWIQAK